MIKSNVDTVSGANIWGFYRRGFIYFRFHSRPPYKRRQSRIPHTVHTAYTYIKYTRIMCSCVLSVRLYQLLTYTRIRVVYTTRAPPLHTPRWLLLLSYARFRPSAALRAPSAAHVYIRLDAEAIFPTFRPVCVCIGI